MVGKLKGRVSAGDLQTKEGAAMGPLSMEQALAEEAVAIGGLGAELEGRLKREAGGQDSERNRTDKNADVRDGDHDAAMEADSRNRKKFTAPSIT
jgi:hypothetical protein